ncbi:TPA: hypothetical protein ACH3X1_001007 [Trebouxia sp. C0004]
MLGSGLTPACCKMGQFEELREQFRKADERFSRADQEQKQLRQSVETLQENVEVLEINLQYTKTIPVSVILRELLKHFRELVWSIQHPGQKYFLTKYNKWILSKNMDADDVVPFVNDLLPTGLRRQKAIVTWGFLRQNMYHPSHQEDQSRSPTGRFNMTTHTHSTDAIAFAVKATAVQALDVITYEIMLKALERYDVLDTIKEDKLQNVNAFYRPPALLCSKI